MDKLNGSTRLWMVDGGLGGAMNIGSDISTPGGPDFRDSDEFLEFKDFVLKRMKKGFMSSREIKDRIPKNSPQMRHIRWLGDALDMLHYDKKVVMQSGVITKYKRR